MFLFEFLFFNTNFFLRWLEKVFKRTVGANSEITLSDFKNIVQSKNVSYFTINKSKACSFLLFLFRRVVFYAIFVPRTFSPTSDTVQCSRCSQPHADKLDLNSLSFGETCSPPPSPPPSFSSLSFSSVYRLARAIEHFAREK
jgi:hypothetical protein